MPWGNGRVLVVAALIGAGAAPARGQAPTAPAFPAGVARVGPVAPVAPASATVPTGEPPLASRQVSTSAPPSQLPVLPPAAAPGDPPGVKDLTPPGFAEPGHGPEAHGAEPHAVGAGGHGGHGEVPGNLLPSYPEEGGLFTTVDFLLLRPRRGGFDYAIPSAAGGLTTSGPIQTLNYELRTGVRAELGYRLGESHWEVLAGYTYFRSNAFGSLIAAPGTALLPTITRPGLTDQVSIATADANLNYNLYDALVARRFAVGEHVALRMLGGVRFADIQQKFNVFYDGIDANQAQVSAGTGFRGFGPMVGGEAVWAGWKGFHLYGRANGGLLTGLSQNPLLEANSAGRAVFVNTSYDVRTVVPFATVGVGGGWQYRTFSLRAGYEVTNFWGIINQPRFTDDVGRGKFVPTTGNLSLEGLFVQAGVQF